MKAFKVFLKVVIPIFFGEFTKYDNAEISKEIITKKSFINFQNLNNINGYLIFSNHLHALDPILIREKLDAFIISKSNLANGNKFYKMLENALVKALKVIRYERGNAKNGEEVKEAILQKINQKNNVLIFPEGDTSYNHKNGLLPLKKGIVHLSFDNKIPIVLLNIWYSDYNFGQGINNRFSLRKTVIGKKDSELYFEEIINPNDFNNFNEYFDYINETMNWNAITKYL